MLGTTSAQFAAAVTGAAYQRAARVTITLPGVGPVAFGSAPWGGLAACEFEEGDQTSYPSNLVAESGLTNMAGSATLAGSVIVGQSVYTVTQLFNPDDPSSVTFKAQQKIAGSPCILSVGVSYPDGTSEFVDRPAYVTTVEVDQTQGVVIVNFSDVPPGWDSLPAMPAVLTPSPWNAGLTNEYVIDRIARCASGGAVSTWPATRSNAVLAVGFRTSMWPEVGTLIGTLGAQPSPTFAAGPYGSGLTSSNKDQYSGSGMSSPSYSLASTIGVSQTMFVEFFVSNLTATNPLNGVYLVNGGGDDLNNVYIAITTSQISVSISNNTPLVWSVPIDTGTHYVGVSIGLPGAGGTSAPVTFYLDGQTFSGTHTLDPNLSTMHGGANSALDTCNVILTAGVYAGLQVATGAQAPNNTWQPSLICDPSLNVLDAVPAIDQGTDAYDELQTVAESELGWLGWQGNVLRFMNRLSVAAQVLTPARSVKARQSLMDLQSATVGASTIYDDIAIDFTGWQFSKTQNVYTAAKGQKIPAKSTISWTVTLPDGITVASVDGSIAYQNVDAAPTVIGTSNSKFRASLDPNGATEIPDPGGTMVIGSAQAITSSQVRFTFTNNYATPVWLVNPSTYPSTTVGTPALWLAGIQATQDNPTVTHVNAGTSTSIYQVPSNAYRQQYESAAATGAFLLSALSVPIVFYGDVSIVPDPRLTSPDAIALDIPVDPNGSTLAQSVMAHVWSTSFSASFDPDSPTWQQTVTARAVAAPGGWILGVGVLETSTYLY